MAKVEIKLDHAGIAEILNSAEVAAMCTAEAHKIAANVAASLPEGTDVVVDSYKTDRAAASVAIRDVMGRGWQVRDGVLTRAAAASGLEVKPRAS